ncbi:unnamed protein product [Symbiodinium sp. CCMP2592]|nr:unnamed protein product [Symbiodinium sp. CCMP2592]CAE7722256.1 unnamed protein product [Symbiodinium sp. CCMP2592]
MSRILPDQHSRRYRSRGSLMLRTEMGEIKDIPDDKTHAPPPAPPRDAKGGSDAASVLGVTSIGSAAGQVDQEAEDREAAELGLKPKPAEATAKAAGKKRRKTAEEVMQDEVVKLEQEFDQLIAQLPTFLDSKSFGQDLGKTDRNLQRKLKEANDHHLYEVQNKIKDKAAMLEAIRSATKAAKAFLSSALGGSKKQTLCKEFITHMSQLKSLMPEAVKAMPNAVRISFAEAVIAEHIEKQNWDEVAEAVSEEALAGIGQDFISKVSSKAVERAVGTILSSHEGDLTQEQNDEEQLVANAAKDVARCINKIVQREHEELREPSLHVASICLLDPPRSTTLDACLCAVTSNPDDLLYRVIHSNSMGLKILQRAHSKNDQLKATADAVTSLIECQGQLDKALADLAPFLANAEIEVDDENFNQILASCEQLCRTFHAAAGAVSVPDPARDSICRFSNELLSSCIGRIIQFFETPLSSLSKGGPLCLTQEKWLWSRTFARKVAGFLADSGPGPVLSSMKEAGCVLPPDLLNNCSRLDNLLDMAWDSVEIIEVFYNLMNQSIEGAAMPTEGWTVDAWQALFSNSDAGCMYQNCSRPSFLGSVKMFCNKTSEKLDEISCHAVQAGLKDGTVFMELVKKVRTKCLPGLWSVLSAAFTSDLIVQSEIYKSLKLEDSVMLPVDSKGVDWSILKGTGSSSGFLFDSLVSLAAVLGKPDEMKELQVLHVRNQVLLKASVVMWTLRETNLSEDTVVPPIQVEGFQRILGTASALLKAYETAKACDSLDENIKKGMITWMCFMAEQIFEAA